MYQAKQVVMVVDCENSDPYRLCATLGGLPKDAIAKINKVMLFDDVNTVHAWQILESYTSIPVEHIMTERVKQAKSLVDIQLTARTCVEHYENNIDSFILVSSDSDYWGLITTLSNAQFLVMIEREKCGPDMKDALASNGIFYCYIEDFNSENHTEIKKTAIFNEIYHYLDENLALNANKMLDVALATARITMTVPEKRQFFEKHIRPMKLVIDADGKVSLELKRF